jgi:hypothetical protein
VARIKSQKGFEKISVDSDFEGACKQFGVSHKWTELINLEFSSQYIEEGEPGIAQTFYMKNLDREEILA